MHSSRFFRVKPIGRLFYEVRKIGKPYNFLPIPTIKYYTVLNDNHPTFSSLLGTCMPTDKMHRLAMYGRYVHALYHCKLVKNFTYVAICTNFLLLRLSHDISMYKYNNND